MRIIPAIDILDGQVVRLTQGDYDTSRTYFRNPAELARFYEDQGFRFLHLVDLDGARQGKVVNYGILDEIATQTSLCIDFGGGVKTTKIARSVLEAGAVQFTAGSIAVKEPELVTQWLEEFGPDRVIVGADVRDRQLAVSGWKEQTDTEIQGFLSAYRSQGAQYVLCTDISRDGMLEGPAFELYEEIIELDAQRGHESSLRLCASGGIHHLDDFRKLEAIGCESVVVGKALLEGRVEARDLVALSD